MVIFIRIYCIFASEINNEIGNKNRKIINQKQTTMEKVKKFEFEPEIAKEAGKILKSLAYNTVFVALASTFNANQMAIIKSAVGMQAKARMILKGGE